MRDLIDLALAFAARALRPGGAMVAKVFMSAEFKAIVSDFERRFRKVEVTRTEASRPGSAELYIIARDFQPARAPAQSGSGDREGDSDDGI
jgi:23S rRNA (uridine2552-2'-O)-methyltransferase